ncbi:MAG TPA: carboxypeptidase-like regulatory domain-containing protein [Pyrinomonadaceae bacterium]|nr:carboxypeptidase-like regulatory domain-containing protein [Pyrinomonadaceae bacterium]
MAIAQGQSSETDEARAGSSYTGKITGRVIGEDGRPMPDAVISVYRSYARVPGPPKTATTDSEGKFQALDLSPGLYTVNATLPGFVTTPDPATETGEARYYRLGDSVNVSLVKGGVITGTVRDANGEPVVAVVVRAVRLRDANGRVLPRVFFYSQPRITDDRGIYRLYGLQPGTYIVMAGGSLGFSGLPNAYDSDAPTFFPSSTRDTAAEISVRSGEEATGTDIRYRGERGRTISGIVSGVSDPNFRYGLSITLALASSGAYESSTFVQPGAKPTFSFSGVADGEYELTAQQGLGGGGNSVSTPRRVTIKGSDVTGIELQLAPLASIAGSAFLEAPPKETCGDKRGATFLETLISTRRDEKIPSAAATRTPFFLGSGSIPDDQGKFTIHNMQTGSYRLTVRLPSDAWYVRSITLPPSLAARPTGAQSKPAETKSAQASSVITIKPGDHVANVTVNIAQDAANLRGRVTTAAEGASLPANLKIYLVPTERERADDVLRYSEASIESDGAFTLANLAPGRYFIIIRPAPENDPLERTPRPLAWDTTARAKLRREAEAANTPIELKTCQRISDQVLRYAPSQATTKP